MIIILLFLDIVAIAVTAKVANGKNFIVGAIIGLVFEFIRIFIAMGIVGSSQSPNDLMVFLINFRIFNIPLLIGVGFFAASASSASSVKQVTEQTQEKPVENVAELLHSPDLATKEAIETLEGQVSTSPEVIMESSDQSADLILERPQAFLFAGYKFIVLVDKNKIGVLNNGGRLAHSVLPGHHMIALGLSIDGEKFVDGSVQSSLTINPKSGDQVIVSCTRPGTVFSGIVLKQTINSKK